MSDCPSIDPLITPYVDGELAAGDRDRVHDHLLACPTCYARVSSEQVIQRLMSVRKSALRGDSAPEELRAKCGALALSRTDHHAFGHEPTVWRGVWRARLAPLALAAALVLIVGGAFLYQVTARSSRVMAAELTADHMKCFAVNGLLRTRQAAETVERSLASGFGWRAHLPEHPDREGLELVGSRPCLYGEGRAAHIMYRHNGHPVSLFMLQRNRGENKVVDVFGHEAAIWSVGDRTYVLITRESRAEVQHLAAFVRASLY